MVSVEVDEWVEVYTLFVDDCHNDAVITSVSGKALKTADLSGIVVGGVSAYINDLQ